MHLVVDTSQRAIVARAFLGGLLAVVACYVACLRCMSGGLADACLNLLRLVSGHVLYAPSLFVCEFVRGCLASEAHVAKQFFEGAPRWAP